MSTTSTTPTPPISVARRFFCLFGAATSFFLLVNCPAGGASFLQRDLPSEGLILMCTLNLLLAASPWPPSPTWARFVGVLITVVILFITPMTIGLPFVHLIPWVSAVSGLDLWKRRDRLTFWIYLGFLGPAFFLSLIYVVVRMWEKPTFHSEDLRTRPSSSIPSSMNEQQFLERASPTPMEDAPEGTGQRYNPPVFYNDKPIIYLYPEQTQRVDVKLKVINGTLTATYPPYDFGFGGWRVIAEPGGTIHNLADNQPYSYLFWESVSASPIVGDLAKGFAVRGTEIREFLGMILPKTGLLPREYHDFIVYWYPRLMNIPLMHIYFAGAEYDAVAPLTIEPEPDSLLRVFMVVRPLEQPIELQPQLFEPFERKGFTVVEWGGTLIAN